MFLFKKSTSSREDILTAIRYAFRTQKRTAIFSKRFSGKTTSIILFLNEAFESNQAQSAIIIVPSDTAVESYVNLVVLFLKTGLKCENVGQDDEGLVYGKRADGTVFRCWCLSPRTMKTCYSRVTETLPGTIVMVDEINAFHDLDLEYLRLHLPFFIALGSHDIENTLVGKLIGFNYNLSINSLQF